MRRRGAIAAFLAVALAAPIVLARAGGGEHYGGGSSDFGGGSSGGGGGGGDAGFLFDILWLLARLTVEHPQAMLPVWAVVAGIFIASRLLNAKATTQRGLRGLERQRLAPMQGLGGALAELKARDPAFDQEAFKARVVRVFEAIQEAWFLRRLDPARVHMSDGLHRRFMVLQRLMEAEGRRDAIADVQVRSVRLLRVEHAEAFDAITVLIAASMRDEEVSASTPDDAARVAAKRGRAEDFEEIWTFVRRPDRRTKAEWDVSQGACPNCGAPFVGGKANRCEHCNAIVNSGAYDWVLTEITQVEAYVPHQRRGEAIERLRAVDPGASAEVLQDRALLLFWKWLEATVLVRPGVLRKVATAGFFDRATAELATGDGGQAWLKFPVVGGSDVIEVELDVEGLDRVHVDVRWSATLPGDARPRRRRHVLTMVRATGAQTDRGIGLSTDRCGQCGAPVSATDATNCEYCGHDFTTAERDWLIDELTPWEQWSHVVARPESRELPPHASREERERLLQVLVMVARADGAIDRRERRLLRQCAARWGVAWNTVEDLLATRTLPELKPSNPARAREIVATLVELAKVDGRVDARERALVFKVAGHLRIPEADAEAMLS